MVAQVNSGSIDIGAPILGLQGNTGEVLAGDPIPTPGATVITNLNNPAIVKDGPNLWDDLIPKQPEPEPTPVEEEKPAVTPEPTPTAEPEPEPEQDDESN